MKADYLNAQQARNAELIENSRLLRTEATSRTLPFRIAPDRDTDLTPAEIATLEALQIDAARIAIESVASLSKLNEVDHMGGGLDMIPALMLSMALADGETVDYTIENAHTSIGYYAALASLGFMDRQLCIDGFRRGLDVPGHVSWVPGGTQLNGGRLGVMIPAAVGQALGRKARHGRQAAVFCHCGDAGWLAGHALNGFNAADVHGAPVIFVMHRNGIQLSGTTRQILDRDPRPVVKSLGIEVIETPSLHDPAGLFQAYRQALALARAGRPSLIYPTGYRSTPAQRIDLAWFGAQYQVADATAEFATRQGVALDTEIWVPGALMSYRDPPSMLECLFYVNDLPGGKGHHDGHMKGRDAAALLANPMLQFSDAQKQALETLRAAPARVVQTVARPAPGSANLVLSAAVRAAAKLPAAGQSTSPRAGVSAGYAAIAKAFPEQVFMIDCDLAPSTKIDGARAALAADHQFEMGIEEQVSAIMANGLAMATREPQLVVFATFAAFFEGIAREGFDMWRYQRNLTGVNEGLNVTYHLSHVGACTGRDHFSGWALDWINVGLTYLPYLHRFYAPADARAAFLACCDLAAHSGGHVIGIPRDNLPVLAKQDGSGPLWDANDPWTSVTPFRKTPGARKAILAFGAPACLCDDALAAAGEPVDVYIVNGLPLAAAEIEPILDAYPGGLVTIEDGLIGNPDMGLMGFAGLIRTLADGRNLPLDHLGITDPRIAPSDGHLEVWAHFGLTAAALAAAVKNL